MGLKSAIQAGAKAGFSAIGDVKVKGIYYEYDPGDYDPSVGDSTDIKDGIEIANDVILAKYKSNEVDDEEVFKTDQKALILQVDLFNEPKKNAKLLLGNPFLKDYWRIIDVGKDPASAMWILQIRKTDG